MKVGILSLTSGYNFGGTLQTVALFRTLKRIGHDPLVIDYWPVPATSTPLWRNWGIRRSDRIQTIRRRLLELRHLERFKKKYRNFKRAELDWTEQCNDRRAVENVVNSLDAVIVGSDQVWNLAYHPDPTFMLDGFNLFNGLRVSYGACCGNPTQFCAPWSTRALQRFDAVGVRNMFTADWVRRCTGGLVSPEVVCDPTLLFDEYPRINIDLPERYIAVYNIGRSVVNIAQRQALNIFQNSFGPIPVVDLIATSISIPRQSHSDIDLWLLDPFEWVETIRGASLVLTDSYHAVLFALRYQVPFLATYSELVRAPRLDELSKELGLEGCVMHGDSKVPSLSEPDWVRISRAFQSSRRSSLAFLDRSLTAIARR